MQPAESMPDSPRPNSLSRTQLTVALIVVTLLPFSLVVILYTTLPSIPDPELDVNVAIGPRAWPATESDSARIVPCVILTNPTEDAWNNLNMSVNEQFHFTHPGTVQAGEEVVVPLKFFHTKGNAYFPPESQRLKLLTIYAQIPSGARAIREIEGEVLGFHPPALDR